jgi:hypothetical protein
MVTSKGQYPSTLGSLIWKEVPGGAAMAGPAVRISPKPAVAMRQADRGIRIRESLLLRLQ